MFDEVPSAIVDGLSNFLQMEVPSDVRRALRRFVCTSLDIFYRSSSSDEWSNEQFWNLRNFLNDTVLRGEWYRFYDFCEVVWEFLGGDRRDQYENSLNSILRRNFVGYELRKGRIERVGASAPDAAMAEARGILRDPRFQGPNDQFLKAIGFYSDRPEPDAENCVKEAVGAVEGTARILLQDGSILLSDAGKELVKRGKLHPTLQKVLDGVYAYRGAAEGVGHGRTGEPKVTIEDAEFVLNTSAALIVYLARLYGIEVVM